MWMYILFGTALVGTFYGVAPVTDVAKNQSLGSIVDAATTIGGVILAILVLITMSQHSETEQRSVELAGLLEGYKFAGRDTTSGGESISSLADQSLDLLAERFDAAFVGEDHEKLPFQIQQIATAISREEASELTTAWRRLHAIATRRVHWSFWLAMAFFLFGITSAVMQLNYLAPVKIAFNLTIGAFAALTADIDNPFRGIFTLKNPFKEAEKD